MSARFLLSFSKTRKITFLFAAIILGFIGYAISTFFVFGPVEVSEQFSEVVWHGPNPSTQLISTESMSATATQAISGNLSAGIQSNIENLATGGNEKYGIAAGGGLIYLGQKELNQYFQTLKSLGVKWVRWDVEWGAIQPKNSEEYQWEGADRVAATAEQYGIHSLGILTYTPAWAASSLCVSKQRCEPANPAEFGRFAKEAAARYKDTITYWEIWNEPNYTFFWNPKPDVSTYAAVLEESYTAIKEVKPDAVVLTGGLAATGNESDGSISPIDFIRTLYKLGANRYFDAIALHPYTYPASPNYKAWWNRWQQIIPIRQIMVTNGDQAKKVWITEFGVPTGGPGRSYTANQLNGFEYGVDFMNEGSQLYLMIEAFDFYQKHSDWMGPFFWYSLQDSSDKRDTPENFFGLLRYDGSPKPSFTALKSLMAL